MEGRHAPLLALGYKPTQRDLQIGSGDAAEAAVAEERDLITAAAHKRIIYADAAELVDDHGSALALRSAQEALHQRRLSRAKKSRDDGHGNARAACALERSSEPPRLAGREDVEHQLELRVPDAVQRCARTEFIRSPPQMVRSGAPLVRDRHKLGAAPGPELGKVPGLQRIMSSAGGRAQINVGGLLMLRYARDTGSKIHLQDVEAADVAIDGVDDLALVHEHVVELDGAGRRHGRG